jgi:ligand-binding sensor domain-containing protein
MSTPAEKAKDKSLKVETSDIGKHRQVRKDERITLSSSEANVHRVLISNNIRSISAAESSVWVATDRGVSKLDRSSNTWTHYTKDDGLGSDAVHVVVSEGNLIWFGTDNGVTLYDVNLQRWRTFREKDGLRGGRVKSIAIESNYVWAGTEGGGLNRYDRNTDSWASRTQKDGLSNNGVNAIAIDSKYIWVGTHYGVNRYDRITDSWNLYFKKDGLVADSVWAIGIAGNFVWFGSPWNGISVYDVVNQAFMRTYTKTDLLSSNDIRSIVIDGNNIWIGSANGGAQRYIEAVNTWVQYTTDDGLASNHITCIAVHKNEIWFGTYDGGVSMYNKVKNSWMTYVKADSPPEDDVKEITRDSFGNLWTATSSGLLEYNPESKEWTRYDKKDGLATNFITTIIADENNLWIGTARGLASYNVEVQQWRFYNKEDGLSEEFITALAVTSDNGQKSLWVGTNRGLFSCQIQGLPLNPSVPSRVNSVKGQLPTGKFVAFPELKQNNITAIVREGNCIWIGTTVGIFQYNPATQKATLYTTEHGLADNYVNSILVLDNRVWVGTRNGISIMDTTDPMDGHGHEPLIFTHPHPSRGGEYISPRSSIMSVVSYYDENKTWRTISEADGLPNHNVRALTEDIRNHIIWIGTPTGLARYDNKTDSLGIISGSTVYGIKSIAAVTDDILWLGTACGIVEYKISTGDFREYRAFVVRQPLLEPSIANIEFDGDTIWFSNWANSHNGAIIRYNRRSCEEERRSNHWQRFTRETILKDTKIKAPTRIKSISVDSKWVWFATDYGVLQYDKLEDTWQHFTMKDGLLSDNIRTIAVGDNVVWVCPEERTRINKYDKKTGKFSEIKLSHLIHPRNYIYDMKADGDSVWLSLSSSGVRRISENDEETVYMKEDGMAQTGARCIEVDENYVWVAHWKGRGSGTLSRYDKKSSKWTVYSKGDVLEEDVISKLVIGQKYLWIIYEAWREGSVTGFDRIASQGEWTTIKPQKAWGSEVKELCEDGPYLWLALEIGGIKRLHLASGTWTSFNEGNGLLMNYINDRALKADERYLWVGTPRGIARYDKQTESWTNYTKQGTLTANRIQAVVADDRYVWCGISEGISRYDKVYGTWRHLYQPWGDWRTVTNVNALAVDDRYLWIGRRGGAYRYDKITDRWDGFGIWNGLPGEDISDVVVDGYDVWLGTNGGICKFPRMSDNLNDWVSYTSGVSITSEVMSKEYAATLVSNEVWCMDADKDDIWVGTMRGISRYNKRKDIWTTYTTEIGLPNNEISSLCIDGDTVWFGNNSGVTRYDKKTQKWVTYTADDGLISNKITCITKGQDAIWFGTFDEGVMKYDKNTQQWQVYQRKDGLAHNCVLSIAVDGDKLWLGTPWGLSRYDIATKSFTTYTENGDSEDILEMVTSSKTEAQPEDTYAGPVIGNKKTNKYHHPDSPSARSIQEDNRVYFNSPQEAEAAGYKRAGNFKL